MIAYGDSCPPPPRRRQINGNFQKVRRRRGGAGCPNCEDNEGTQSPKLKRSAFFHKQMCSSVHIVHTGARGGQCRMTPHRGPTARVHHSPPQQATCKPKKSGHGDKFPLSQADITKPNPIIERVAGIVIFFQLCDNNNRQ